MMILVDNVLQFHSSTSEPNRRFFSVPSFRTLTMFLACSGLRHFDSGLQVWETYRGLIDRFVVVVVVSVVV
jgi:hypothetical protein